MQKIRKNNFCKSVLLFKINASFESTITKTMKEYIFMSKLLNKNANDNKSTFSHRNINFTLE